MIIRKTIQSYLIALSWLLSIPVVGMIYVNLNHHNVKTYSLVTDFDHNIPFLKIFILPYVTWFIFILVSFIYLCIKNRQIYYRTIVYFNLGLVICDCIYFFFQTYVPRPALTEHDWLTHMVQFVYNNDQPYNCFPSTHALTSYFIMKAFQSASNISRTIRMVVSLISLLIMVSIIFVKQHVVLDLIGAVGVVEVIYYIHRWVALKVKGNRLEGQHLVRKGSAKVGNESIKSL